jgi:hypothetical protein
LLYVVVSAVIPALRRLSWDQPGLHGSDPVSNETKQNKKTVKNGETKYNSI